MAKENQLKVQYRDGSTRVIQVSPEFFNTVQLYDHRLGKMVEYTAREKCISLAESCGAEPYIIELHYDNNELFRKIIDNNRPLRSRPLIAKDRRNTKKELRKEFKNIPFTNSYKWQGGGLVWKQLENKAA